MTSFIDLAKNWVSIDPCDDTKSEIEKMVAAGDESGLEKIMSSRLEFGTAGLRGPMGSGYNRMNCLTILQTCQGLAKYLIEQFGEQEAKSRGAVIGFDHRETAIEGSTAESSLSSLKFARMSAAVFLSLGFKVYLLENLVPTPFVAFGVTHLKCCCGIMVTASHNPMRDNGFKVYWDNGAQIIPPHDSGISR